MIISKWTTGFYLIFVSYILQESLSILRYDPETVSYLTSDGNYKKKNEEIFLINSKKETNEYYHNRKLLNEIMYRKRRIAEDINTPESIKKESYTCGRNGMALSDKLKDVSWPWAVSVIIADTKSHHCGAALISRYHILSAAHCFVFKEGTAKKERMRARLGEYDFKTNTDTDYTDYEVAALINHEDYDLTTYENDIALLILAYPVHFSVYVQPICMPKYDEEYSDRTATVIGWGNTKSGGKGSPILKQIEIPVWQFASCFSNISQTIFTTNLCAADGDGKRDSCQGDSGGPLMMKTKDGRWELVGIVSWGVKCASKGKPGVYTQVNKYFDWIYDQINGR